MNKKVTLWALGLSVGWFCSCVDEYTLPENISDIYQQEVLIEGRILSGEESVFYITKTVPLDDNSRQTEYVKDAKIYIIGQNGYRSPLATFIEDAKYTVEAVDLPFDTQYAVEVEVDGDIYQSEYQPLLKSPEIDEITWKEYDGEIGLRVSTHNDEGATRCYMWTFEEDWEFHAELDIFHMPNIMYMSSLYPKEEHEWNPYYFCWGHNNSSSIYIYNTEDLTENRVTNHELFRRSMDDIRISYIYSLLVKQFCISTEAYEYYRLMKLYTEDSDGLFTPMPSDVRGNVYCASNPEKSVRGLITASNVTEKRVFVYASDFQMNTANPGRCSYLSPNLSDPYWTFGWYSMIENQGYVATVNASTRYLDDSSILYTPYCVNCLLEEGASKKRPDFWPNNHE